MARWDRQAQIENKEYIEMKKGKSQTLNQFTGEETFEEDQPEIMSEHVHERTII